MQVNLPLGGLPITLICLSNGTIGFQPAGKLRTMIDQQPSDKVSAIIYDEGMLVGNTEIEWIVAYDYKQMPDLLGWLKQQELIMPEFKQGVF